MENKRHTVYQSLNRKPKVTGLSLGLFGIQMAGSVIVFLFIGGWVGFFCSFICGFFLHGLLMKAEKKDDLFLILWFGKIFKGDNYYKAKGSVSHTSNKKTKSISTFH